MQEDPRPLHRAALAAAAAQVRRVGPDDLNRATPCPAWDLAALLAHMIGQHVGFAAAIRTGSAPREAYAPQPYTPARWAGSVSALLEAVGRADLDAEVVLVEIAPTPRPVRWAVEAQLLDTVVHTWDVARALGTTHVPAAALVAVVARGAAAVPTEGRTHPGAAFAPVRPVVGTEWERALALLGREPRSDLTLPHPI